MKKVICFSLTLLFLVFVVAVGCYYKSSETEKSVEATLI